MAPRGKGCRSEVQKCLRCGVILHANDTAKHDSECFVGLDQSETDVAHSESSRLDVSLKTAFVYGFVHPNGTLYAVSKSLKAASSNATPSKSSAASSDLPPNPKQGDLILIHPSTMTLARMSIGSPIRAFREETIDVDSPEVICTAWPSELVPQFSAVLSDDTKSRLGIAGKRVIDKRLCLSTLTGDVVKAARMTLTPTSSKWKPTLTSPAFLKFLRRDVLERVVSEGSLFVFKYFGQDIVFEVSTLEPTTSYSRTDDPSLDGSFAKLTLNYADVDEESGRSSIREQSLSEADEPCERLKNEVVCSTPRIRASKGDFSKGYYLVVNSTKIEVKSILDKDSPKEMSSPSTTLADVGGLDKEAALLFDLLNASLNRRASLLGLGASPPRGVIVHGPSGVGKSLMIDAVLSHHQWNVVRVKGSELWSKQASDADSTLSNYFDVALATSPAVLLFDDLSAVCTKKGGGETERRIFTMLTEKIDELNNSLGSESSVFLVGVTNSLESVDVALRRQGRFDKEIEIPVPSPHDRLRILKILLRSSRNFLSEVELKTVADGAHGFVGADLASLCQSAALFALQRHVECAESLTLKLSDFQAAYKEVRPSAMKEVVVQTPDVKWDDIGGQCELKNKLKQAVEWPLRHPQAFVRMGISPPRGLLMYGPPGCSKTMIAKALANESGLNFLSVKGPELFDKYVGQSERAVRDLFRRARAAAPAIVFFDEIEALAAERGGGGTKSGRGNGVGDRVLAQILTEMDGVQQLDGVTVIAATNRPDLVDRALLRPGRMDRVIYVPLPDAETRADIIRLRFRRMPIGDDVVLEELVGRTRGFSGAEVVAVCHEAALASLAEGIDAERIWRRHFDTALDLVKPQVNEKLIHFYETYEQTRDVSPV